VTTKAETAHSSCVIIATVGCFRKVCCFHVVNSLAV